MATSGKSDVESLIKEIESSATPDAGFFSLEPRLKKLLSRRFLTEILQGQEQAEMWLYVSEITPYIDALSHLNPVNPASLVDPRRIYPYIDHWNNEWDEDERWFDRSALLHFRALANGISVDDDNYEEDEHSHSSDANNNDDKNETSSDDSSADQMETDTNADGKSSRDPEKVEVKWNSDALYSDKQGSKLKVCLHQFFQCTKCHPRLLASPSTPDLSFPFYRRISPTLLLYRLIITYGMWPEWESPRMHEGCHWRYRLFCVDDKSFLDFVDYKGKAAVRFVGSLAAHRSAIGEVRPNRDSSNRPKVAV